MTKFNKYVEANIIRAVHNKVATVAAALVRPDGSVGVPIKDSNLRDPLVTASEDECLQFRWSSIRKPKMRTGQYMAVCGFEVHCWTKRGDLRQDKATDRHVVLACEIDNAFQELDLPVYDYVGGHRDTLLGSFQVDESDWHFRDKRNTIFGQDVDYSQETPTTLQAVVVVSGLLIRGA